MQKGIKRFKSRFFILYGVLLLMIYIFFSQKFENNVKFLFLILWWIWNQFTILTVILHSFGGEIIWCEDKVITLFFFPKVLKFIIIDVSLNFSWKVWMVIQKNQNSYLLKKTKSLSGCSSSSHVWSAGLDLAVKSLPSWYFAQDCTSYSHSALLSLFLHPCKCTLMTQTRSEVIKLTHRLAMKGLNRGTKTFLSSEHFRHSLIYRKWFGIQLDQV